MAITVTIKETDNLQAVIDFISSNSDGAEDHEVYEEMQSLLQSIWLKAIKDLAKRRFKYDLKKLNKK